ncbi:hypothetical protein [Streptomyces eurythermus]|uniref:hypothetical protein n=1 Tax=Streptomyces eurythermus TaxID=42237 RepID=UPI0033FBC8FF
MADEQDKWLDRGTAERLLRGESLEAVDPSARDQAIYSQLLQDMDSGRKFCFFQALSVNGLPV